MHTTIQAITLQGLFLAFFPAAIVFGIALRPLEKKQPRLYLNGR